jgi:hypothetical protein|tara:strand:- start:3137 stop:3694 length:558 start_codon:yes stop_codon:yes gene_type:complete
MKIAISINGVIRDLFGKIKLVHKKYYDSDVEETLNYDNVRKLLKFDSDDDFLEFLYREAPMEIFGHATETKVNLVRNLNELTGEHKEHEFTLISDEVGRGIPATFWFLAKYGCSVKNIKFYNVNSINNLWNDFDLIFTNDEPIIKSKPEDKLLYTFNESNGVDSKYVLESPDKITTLKIFQKENA